MYTPQVAVGIDSILYQNIVCMFAQINWAILSPHEGGLGVYKVYCMGIARDLLITCPHNFQVLPAPILCVCVYMCSVCVYVHPLCVYVCMYVCPLCVCQE